MKWAHIGRTPHLILLQGNEETSASAQDADQNNLEDDAVLDEGDPPNYESSREQIAAIEIGLPRIDPELSISNETTVSLKSVSFSFLNEREYIGSIITLVNLDVSNKPSSRSKFQLLFCLASSFLCNLFASLEIIV